MANRDGRRRARFTIRLPLPEAAPEVDRSLDAEDRSRGDDVNSEDEPVQRWCSWWTTTRSGASCARGSKSAGYRLVEAGTGADALREGRDRAPDVVLLDLGLPTSTASRSCAACANGRNCR